MIETNESNPFPHGVPRFCVSVEIIDNDTGDYVIDEGFNTDSISVIERVFEEAAKTIAKTKGAA